MVYNETGLEGFNMSFEMLSDLGIKKYEMCRDDIGRFFARSVVAGLYLGLATILSTTLGTLLFKDNLIASKIAVAGSFGIGLVIIVILGSELFTGNCFTTMIPVYGKKLKFRQIIPMWIVCYFGNFVGIALVCYLFFISGSNHELLSEYVVSCANTKLSFDIIELLVKAVLCNFIVCVGAYEHSIANMGSFTLTIGALGSGANFGLIAIHMIVVTFGNMIGGGVLLGLPLYLMIKPNK